MRAITLAHMKMFSVLLSPLQISSFTYGPSPPAKSPPPHPPHLSPHVLPNKDFPITGGGASSDTTRKPLMRSSSCPPPPPHYITTSQKYKLQNPLKEYITSLPYHPHTNQHSHHVYHVVVCVPCSGVGVCVRMHSTITRRECFALANIGTSSRSKHNLVHCL